MSDEETMSLAEASKQTRALYNVLAREAQQHEAEVCVAALWLLLAEAYREIHRQGLGVEFQWNLGDLLSVAARDGQQLWELETASLMLPRASGPTVAVALTMLAENRSNSPANAAAALAVAAAELFARHPELHLQGEELGRLADEFRKNLPTFQMLTHGQKPVDTNATGGDA